MAALKRRLPASAWHRAGEPRIPLDAIRDRLHVARRLADAHRYLPAVRAYAEAAQLVEAHLPALRAQHARARAEAAEAAEAATALRARRASPIGNRQKRRLADERARDYVDRARKILRKASAHVPQFRGRPPHDGRQGRGRARGQGQDADPGLSEARRAEVKILVGTQPGSDNRRAIQSAWRKRNAVRRRGRARHPRANASRLGRASRDRGGARDLRVHGAGGATLRR